MNANMVSIIIPVRNGARTIGRTLERLTSLRPPQGWQTEIVVGLCPSTDNTREVVERFEGVRIAETPKADAGAARNVAVAASNGALLYFIDSDAFPARDDFLERLVANALALQARGLLGAFGGPVLADPDQRRNPFAASDHIVSWFNWTSKRPSCVSLIFQPGVSIAMPRTVYDRAGGSRENIPILQDYEIQHRIKKLNLPICFMNDIPVCHTDRATPWKAWRHSWRWGTSFRETYLKREQADKWRWLDDRRLFWLNLPRIFCRRVKLVHRSAWAENRRQLLLLYPLVLSNILAWALGVVLGPPEPEPEDEAAS